MATRSLFASLPAVAMAPMAGLLVLFTSACQNTNTKPPEFSVIDNTNNAVRYEGNGVAAGMMLMGAMGPMGAAVGIAIDKGIEKDINTAAQQGGFNAQAITQQWLSEKYALANQLPLSSHNSPEPSVNNSPEPSVNNSPELSVDNSHELSAWEFFDQKIIECGSVAYSIDSVDLSNRTGTKDEVEMAISISTISTNCAFIIQLQNPPSKHSSNLSRIVTADLEQLKSDGAILTELFTQTLRLAPKVSNN